MPAPYLARLALLQNQLTSDQALLLTDANDIYYLSGFKTLVPEEREAFLVVTKAKNYLMYATFSPLPSPLVVETLAGTYPHQLVTNLETILKQIKFKDLLVDKSKLYTDEFEALQKVKGLSFTSFDRKIIWRLRMVKDAFEISPLKKAARIASEAYAQILPEIVAGVTELELQAKLEACMRQLGSPQPAFPTIIAFGDHTALPHHQPSDRKLTNNMAVLLDFGALFDHYRSDMTRSFWFGTQVDPEYLKLENTVMEAYQAVIDLYQKCGGRKQTVIAGDLDVAARDLIDKAGFGGQFVHTTGHGVGLDIHEPPSIYLKNTQTEIKANMVITVEPGIYLPGKFGFRYENTVLVTDKELVEITK